MPIFASILSTIIWVVVGLWIWSKTHENDEQREREKRRQNNLILLRMGEILAHMAKVDGRISREEAETASRMIRRLGLSDDEYRLCAGAFNSIRATSPEAFANCAVQLAGMASREARTLVYELLWMIAAADGTITDAEDAYLRNIAGFLDIEPNLYRYYRNVYLDAYSGAGARSSGAPPRREDELAAAYKRLDSSPSDSNEEIRKKYRKLAMRYHPDRLRAEGVPEGMIEKATRSMAEINAAWEAVRKARGI